MDELFYEKFRDVLRDALLSKETSFPDGMSIEIEFQPINSVFRVIERKPSNMYEIDENDFTSQAEKAKAKVIKGTESTCFSEIGKYSCSLCMSKENLKRVMSLPKKKKYIIVGNIYDTNGVINKNMNTGHIHLWLYQNNEIHKQFKFDDEEE